MNISGMAKEFIKVMGITSIDKLINSHDYEWFKDCFVNRLNNKKIFEEIVMALRMRGTPLIGDPKYT